MYVALGFGGTKGYGTIDKIAPDGTATVIYAFSGPDGRNANCMVFGTDDNIYGATYQGGANDTGMVFKLSPTGTLTTLHAFDENTEGANPGGLFQGQDGNFYGYTYLGGSSSGGTVFRITPTGTVTILHAFSLGPYYGGLTGLTQGADDNLYSLTEADGTYNKGTFYKLTLSGTLTVLYSFNEATGSTPHYLIQAADGKPDLLFQNPKTGQLAIWYLSGNYAVGGAFVYPKQDPGWRCAGTGDFNGDGQIELLFQNKTSGNLAVWYMDKTYPNYAQKAALVPMPQSPAWKAVSVADYDDGATDILFQSQTTGQLAIWYMGGIASFDGAFLVPGQDPNWQVAGPR